MKKLYIVIFIIIAIILITVAIKSKTDEEAFINDINNEIISNSEQQEKNDIHITQKSINNFEKADNNIVAKVNDEEIDEKQICITEYFFPDSEDLINQEIENTVLVQLAKENNLTIKETDQEYINKIITGMNDDILNNGISNNPDEYLEKVKEYLQNIFLISEYRRLINSEMKNGTLEIDDLELKKEYEDYLNKYSEWKINKDVEEYKDITDMREDIINKYMQYKVKQANIKTYMNNN